MTERLAEFKRQKAMEEVKIPLVDVETHAKTVTTARKSRHDIKEGMKWAFILAKPNASRHRARQVYLFLITAEFPMVTGVTIGNPFSIAKTITSLS